MELESLAVSEEVIGLGRLDRLARRGIHAHAVHRAPGFLRVERIGQVRIGEIDQPGLSLPTEQSVEGAFDPSRIAFEGFEDLRGAAAEGALEGAARNINFPGALAAIGRRPGQHPHENGVVGLAVFARYFTVKRAAAAEIHMIGLREFLPRFVAVAAQEGDEVAIVDDALAQIARVRQMAIAHPAMFLFEGLPCLGAHTLRRRAAFPIGLADFAFQQQHFDGEMRLTAGNFGVNPGVALQEVDLLIHLLVQARHDGCTGRFEQRDQSGFIPQCRRDAGLQRGIEAQIFGEGGPDFCRQRVARLTS
ncbi:MAG: hypothetical protein BWY25_01177 [Chloroflexi bacterium ADurb.Bin222]|nr:MAG: hypothetical protein BWY25_01177 [Chloroflexi bacterium ADurb.Bin222]